LPVGKLFVAPEVVAARAEGTPLVALESALITHGLPRLLNLEVARRLEATVREEVAAMARAREALGLTAALLVCVPVPARAALPWEEAQAEIEAAVAEAEAGGVGGRELTPFLLARLAERAGGRSCAANEALLVNNACVAARLASAL